MFLVSYDGAPFSSAPIKLLLMMTTSARRSATSTTS